jgi:hypothetical protein
MKKDNAAYNFLVTKKYSKNEQLMNKTLKDLWKYNKNATRTW